MIPTVAKYVKQSLEQIHALDFSIPECTIPYYIMNLEDYGGFSQGFCADYMNEIQLSTILFNDDLMLRQTIIHETLHFYQSKYDPRSLALFKKPWNNDHLTLYEIAAIWIEKKMDEERINANYQLQEGGLCKSFDNNFRLGLSTSAADLKELYPNSREYQEQGYALAPLLKYMIDLNPNKGGDSNVHSLYKLYWNNIYKANNTILEVLHDWYNACFNFFFFRGNRGN